MHGFGYWSGRDVRLEFRPAAVGAGVTFVRSDLGPTARIPARIEYRIDAARRTNLQNGVAHVEMVEHVVAALAGLGIDNCEVWTNQAEMPGCDGSSAPFVDALLRVGIVQQGVEAPRIRIAETLRATEGDCWIEARPSAKSCLSIEYQLDYPQAPVIGRQVARIAITPERFRSELAPCRTFLLQSEADFLIGQGLGSRVTPRDLLLFDEKGPVGNSVRFPNECARHKALDVLGDLSLTGYRLIGDIVAHRSGHRLHAQLARQITARYGATATRASA